MKKNSIMKGIAAFTLLLMATLGVAAQDNPKFEVPVVFSFVNVHPNVSQLTSFNVFGGGGGFVYNVTPWIGVKADFNGYTQSNVLKMIGGNVGGNVFTYLFGPQIKRHSGRIQPFGEALFGAAHSNLYANILTAGGYTSASSSSNAFAMEFGGGCDIRVTNHFQIRPVEVDYLYTRFGANTTGYGGSQNNFKYSGGINLTFGGK